MPPRFQRFRTLHFKGPRFEDHRLDIDDLVELRAWKETLIEVAKVRWRSAHPGAVRLPKDFLEKLDLRITGLVRGSTGVAIVRSFGEEGDLPLEIEDELDEAARVLDILVGAAASGDPVPDGVPVDVIELFLEKKFGATLREGDSLEWSAPDGADRGGVVRFTPEARDRIKSWAEECYEDSVDRIGEVREVDLDGFKFKLRMGPEYKGAKVTGSFRGYPEGPLVEALRDHETRRLRVIGRGEFRSRDGALRKIVSVERLEPLPLEGECFREDVRPYWEVIAEIGARVPEEEWARLPSDLSERIDRELHDSAGPRK